MSPVSRWWGIAIGVGLALSPIHNQWLTILATNANGETLFFLPAFAYLLLIIGSGLFVTYNWERVRGAGLGNRKIWIPLAVIVVAIGLSGATADTWQDKVAPLGMGLALFALYLASRIIGQAIFLPLAVGASIASLGVILHGLIFPGLVTGGFVFEKNYDIVVGYVLLGTVLYQHKRQWLAVSLALVAMFLTGSPEAVFAVGVIGAVVLLRRDVSRRLAVALLPTVALVVIWFGIGYGQELYSYVGGTIRGVPVIETQTGTGIPGTTAIITPGAPTKLILNTMDIDSGDYSSVFGYRLAVIKKAMSNIKPLGEGYILTAFSTVANVHNVPLVIVQQLGYPGILAGLAWSWVSVRCLWKTKWKYAWITLLVLSVWDHFTWTQLAPLWPVLVGVSTVADTDTDFIFKKQ